MNPFNQHPKAISPVDSELEASATSVVAEPDNSGIGIHYAAEEQTVTVCLTPYSHGLYLAHAEPKQTHHHCFDDPAVLVIGPLVPGQTNPTLQMYGEEQVPESDPNSISPVPLDFEAGSTCLGAEPENCGVEIAQDVANLPFHPFYEDQAVKIIGPLVRGAFVPQRVKPKMDSFGQLDESMRPIANTQVPLEVEAGATWPLDNGGSEMPYEDPAVLIIGPRRIPDQVKCELVNCHAASRPLRTHEMAPPVFQFVENTAIPESEIPDHPLTFEEIVSQPGFCLGSQAYLNIPLTIRQKADGASVEASGFGNWPPNAFLSIPPVDGASYWVPKYLAEGPMFGTFGFPEIMMEGPIPDPSAITNALHEMAKTSGFIRYTFGPPP